MSNFDKVEFKTFVEVIKDIIFTYDLVVPSIDVQKEHCDSEYCRGCKHYPTFIFPNLLNRKKLDETNGTLIIRMSYFYNKLINMDIEMKQEMERDHPGLYTVIKTWIEHNFTLINLTEEQEKRTSYHWK
jgi:hypothetical protein